MKKWIVIWGSVCASGILVLAALTSVAHAQVIKSSGEQFSRYVETAVNFMQKSKRFSDGEREKLLAMTQHFLRGNVDGNWQPGMFLALFLAVMSAVFQAIANGQWVPGMIFGAMILYLILVWLILFGESAPSS